MENLISEVNPDSTESDFMEFIQRGDDFFKIELLRPAKRWYLKALEMNSGSQEVKFKIAECERLLAFERKVILILSMIALATILISLLVF